MERHIQGRGIIMQRILEDLNLSAILEQLAFNIEKILDKNEQYVVLKCTDKYGKHVVLKYNHSRSKEASRKINNEIILTKNLVPINPLFFLKYYTHGTNYLVTEFDNGTLLLPNIEYDEQTVRNLVKALINFQLMPVEVKELGLRDRTGLIWFYLKDMIKHLLHLWPYYINSYEAVKCLWILLSGFPAIKKNCVICHADFRPTNLIYNAPHEAVTFTDLEAFLTENHPLYDVISFCTVDDIDISKWRWQKYFLRYYLDRAEEQLSLDRLSKEFKTALRGILIYFLVYRFNETRAHVENMPYFDGLDKRDFLIKKAKTMLSGKAFNNKVQLVNRALQIRRDNLACMLSKRVFCNYLKWLLGE